MYAEEPLGGDIVFNEKKIFPNTNGELWRNEYRRTDLELMANRAGKQKIKQSFEGYGFSHPKGILQYAGLPQREYFQKNNPSCGLTNLHRLHHLGKHFQANISIKDESGNPSGCFKDRESTICLLHSKSRNHRGAVIYSSGNAALSAAIFTQQSPMHLIAVLPGDTYPEKIDFIRDHGADVILIGDEQSSFEQGYRLYCQADMHNGRNNGKIPENSSYGDWSVRNPFRTVGDKTTAVEIVKQFHGHNGKISVPDYIIVPTANGSCLTGIWKGFEELYSLGIIDRLPKMVSAGIDNASPVYGAVQKKKTKTPFRCDPSKMKDEDKRIGSIIVAEEGYDSLEAARAVLESGGMAVEVGWKKIKKMLSLFLESEQKLVDQHDILPEPASLTALAAIEELKNQQKLKKNDDKVVAVLTGQGIKAKRKILELVDENPAEEKLVREIMRRQEKTLFPKAGKRGGIINIKADENELQAAFHQLKQQHEPSEIFPIQ